MEIKKLLVEDQKFDLNSKFYFWLKHIVKNKFTTKEVSDLIYNLSSSSNLKSKIDSLHNFINVLRSESKKVLYSTLVSSIHTEIDLEIFIFSLELFQIKDLLLQESKIKQIIIDKNMHKEHPLSIKYDEMSLRRPYSTRVNGALLALLFFENIENKNFTFMSKDAEDYILDLSNRSIYLKNHGIEPNQIFMLMFSESINQSIISDSGSDYESRIRKVLVDIGIDQL
jgi:hypothetical protein